MPEAGPSQMGTLVGVKAGAFDRWSDDILDTKLSTFWTALANRAAAPVDVLVIGDSVAEGSGSSATSKRFISKLRDILRARYPVTGVTGGVGYLPAFNTDGALTVPWTSGGGTPTAHSFDYGLGAKSYELDAGAWMQTVQVCSSFEIHYVKSAAGGSFEVKIDGVAVATVNTVAGGTTDHNVWSSGPLTPGSKTIRITQSAGASVVIDGAMIYNGDEARGIRLWDAGHGGASTASLNSYSPTWGPVGVARAAPDLIVIEIGLNDVTMGGTNIATNLQTIITNLRTWAGTSPSILLVGMYERTGAAAGPLGGWEVYYPYYLAAAVGDGNVAFIDFWGRWQQKQLGALNNLGFTTDGIHPNDAGHLAMADAIADFIAAPVGSDVPAAWLHPIVPAMTPPSSKVGTWIPQLDTSAVGNGYYKNTSNAQNDEINYDLILGAGTYTFDLHYTQTSSSAIATFSVDDGNGNFTTVGTIDMYGGATAYSTFGTIAGVVLTGPVMKRRVKIKLATRNASASNWLALIQGIQVRRTA